MASIVEVFIQWAIDVRLDLYLVTGLMALIWAASEVIVSHPDRPVQALRTGGARLLILINVAFAWLVYAAALALVPNSQSIWMALGTGLSWQAMLRGGINIQPLPASSVAGASNEELGVPLNELYARLQAFCVGQIQRALVGRRVELMERVIAELDIAELARTARLVTTALSEEPGQAEQYIERIQTNEGRTPEEKEILLISLILDNRGGDILRQRVREKK